MIKEEKQQQQHISSARDGLASRSAKTNSTAGRCVCVCVNLKLICERLNWKITSVVKVAMAAAL